MEHAGWAYLRAWDPEDALVVEAVQVDDPDAALHHEGDVLLGQLQVLLLT